MPRYLMSIYQPDGPAPEPGVLGKIMKDLDQLNKDMREAGAWVFTAGLFPAESSTVLRASDGEVVMTDGPYVEGKEHVGGFWIIQANDLDEALEWGVGSGRLHRGTATLADRGRAAEPCGLDHHDSPQPGHRPAPAGSGQARQAGRSHAHPRRKRAHRGGRRARRPATPHLHLLSPALAPVARVALTLRLLGGLTTAEIAHAFLNARQVRTWVLLLKRCVPTRDPRPFRCLGSVPRCARRCRRRSLDATWQARSSRRHVTASGRRTA
jgi:hypothetical protein